MIQLYRVTHKAIAQQIDTVDISGLDQLHPLGDRAPYGAVNGAGTSLDITHKGHVLNAGAPNQISDGVEIHRTHQVVEAAFHGDLSACQALLLRVGNDLQEGGLSGLLHHGAQLLHLINRQTHFLKAPELGPGIFAGLKNLDGVLHSTVIVGQHDNQFRIHSFLLPSF